MSEGSSKKRKRHSPQQIVEKLREADALLSAGRELARGIQRLGITDIRRG